MDVQFFNGRPFVPLHQVADLLAQAEAHARQEAFVRAAAEKRYEQKLSAGQQEAIKKYKAGAENSILGPAATGAAIQL